MNDDRFDEEIRSRMQELDGVYPQELAPPGDLWQSLSVVGRRRQNRVRVFCGAAASIVLLAVAGWIWQAASSTQTHILSVAELPESVSVPEHDALEYVMRLCRGDHVVCASEDFKMLEADLAASEQSLEEVSLEIARFGGDERLLRAKERIKDQQADIIRAMVQML